MKQKLSSLGLILLGNALYALAVAAFILPNNLITGGGTGIALALNRRFGVSIELFLLAFNAVTILLGLLLLGRKFIAGTLLSSMLYPILIGVFQRIPEIATPLDDPLLAVFCAGGLVGVSLGLVMRAGASTGGMDIPSLILKKYWNISISGSMALLDAVILLWQAVSLPREHLLYAILMSVVYTLVLNRVLLSGSARTQVNIISERAPEINDLILHTLVRTTTLLHARTGYLGQERDVILIVLTARELPRLNRLVLSIDPQAFMIVSNVSEVKGRGFTLEQLDQPLVSADSSEQ